MFGKRDPKQYGTITLDEINESLTNLGKELDVEVEFFKQIVKEKCVIEFTRLSLKTLMQFL